MIHAAFEHPPGLTPPTLDYVRPSDFRRPGLLTAVGIISIVLASLGLLAGVWSILSYGMFLVVAQMPMPVPIAAGPTTPGGSVTNADVAAIVAALDAAQPLSAADQARLAQALQMGELPLAPPAEGAAWTQEHVASQVTASATYQNPAGNTTSFDLNGGSVTLTPTDVVVMASGASGFSTTTVDATGSATTVNMGANLFGGFDSKAMLAGGASSIFNLGLAVLLLVAGIAVLRDSANGRKLHQWWAWLKLPAVVIGTAITVWWTMTFMSDFGVAVTQTAGPGGTAVTASPFSGMEWLMVLPSILMGLIACIYPIAVLIVFRARTIREYYNQSALAAN